MGSGTSEVGTVSEDAADDVVPAIAEDGDSEAAAFDAVVCCRLNSILVSSNMTIEVNSDGADAGAAADVAAVVVVAIVAIVLIYVTARIRCVWMDRHSVLPAAVCAVKAFRTAIAPKSTSSNSPDNAEPANQAGACNDEMKKH
jgi:hypothetical protein